jgi:hypothetical protein
VVIEGDCSQVDECPSYVDAKVLKDIWPKLNTSLGAEAFVNHPAQGYPSEAVPRLVQDGTSTNVCAVTISDFFFFSQRGKGRGYQNDTRQTRLRARLSFGYGHLRGRGGCQDANG